MWLWNPTRSPETMKGNKSNQNNYSLLLQQTGLGSLAKEVHLWSVWVNCFVSAPLNCFYNWSKIREVRKTTFKIYTWAGKLHRLSNKILHRDEVENWNSLFVCSEISKFLAHWRRLLRSIREKNKNQAAKIVF